MIECKNGAVSSLISKSDANQLSGSVHWFRAQYDQTCVPTPLIIHPSRTFLKQASPEPHTRVMDATRLADLAGAFRDFIKGIATNEKYLIASEVEKSLAHFGLTGNQFVDRYSADFSIST